MEFTYPVADCAQSVKYKRILRVLQEVEKDKVSAERIEYLKTKLKSVTFTIFSRRAEIEHLQDIQVALLIELSTLQG